MHLVSSTIERYWRLAWHPHPRVDAGHDSAASVERLCRVVVGTSATHSALPRQRARVDHRSGASVMESLRPEVERQRRAGVTSDGDKAKVNRETVVASG